MSTSVSRRRRASTCSSMWLMVDQKTKPRAALAISEDDIYALSAYSDFLLDRDRAGEVRDLLAGFIDNDALLLRLALAEQRLSGPGLSKYLRMLVFDEADEIVGRGFEEQIGDLVKKLPADVQISLFSATMRPEVLAITKELMRDPAKILVKNQDLTLEGVKQYFVSFDKEDQKFVTLGELFKNLSKPFSPRCPNRLFEQTSTSASSTAPPRGRSTS